MWKLDNIIKGHDTNSGNCVAIAFYSNITDSAQTTYDVCYEVLTKIDTTINQVVTTRMTELNKLVFNIEMDKEQLKPALIEWLYLHTESTLEEFLAYAETTFGWYNRALTERLVYEYANNAILLGLASGELTSLGSAYMIILGLVNTYPQDALLKFF